MCKYHAEVCWNGTNYLFEAEFTAQSQPRHLSDFCSERRPRGSVVGAGENLLGTVRVLLTSVTRSCRYPLLVFPPAPMHAEHIVPHRVSHSLECHATL